MPTPVPGLAEACREFTFENLLDSPEGKKILTCIQCDVCAGTCPYGEAMDYPPRRIVNMMRSGQLDKVFSSDSLLFCVACYACMAKCPRGIRLTEVLLPLMKEQTLVHMPELPAELQKALQNTLRYSNPMGESSRKRAAWLKTSPVPIRVFAEDPRPADVLWFVECYSSYYPRGQDNARATARIFHALGIDFAVLGNEEKCAGECGRLTWEPGLFETLMDYNMAMFQRYRFNRIVTACPHAYNAFNIRYPTIGFHYEVHHTTPYFVHKLDRLKPLLTKKLNYKVTYHDSYCLGRQNEFCEEPRTLLRAIPGLKQAEMPKNREHARCCGAGGGRIWMEDAPSGHPRPAEIRVREAAAVRGVSTLAVACPKDLVMFQDAVKTTGLENKLAVRDLAELVKEHLTPGERSDQDGGIAC